MAFGIDDAIAAGLAIINKFIPDPAERAKAEAELRAQAAAAQTAQIDVNQVEAATGSIFIGGWRPFIGWVCGAAFAWQYVLLPIVAFFVVNYTGHPMPALPAFDDVLYELLFGMLGLSGLRTFEKLKGIDTTTIKPKVKR